MLVQEIEGQAVEIRSQLDFIDGLNYIVMIRSGLPGKLDFEFHSSENYKLIQKITINKQHFDVATLAGMLRTEEENDFKSQTAAIYTSQRHAQPIMLVRFRHNEEAIANKITIEATKTFDFEVTQRLLNAFELTCDTTLLAMGCSLLYVKFEDQTWNILKRIEFNYFGLSINRATCFHSGHKTRDEFLVGFDVLDTYSNSNSFERQGSVKIS